VRLFAQRPGIGVEIEKGETYEVDVVSVADGDTVDVQFPDGDEAPVRILGIDTPETGDTAERIEEYEGITDEDALRTKANEASTYAEDRLGDTTVTLSFDDNEPLRGDFDRILGYLELPNGEVYNEEIVADGLARLYSSGFGGHDDLWDLEDSAQQDGRGIWELSDPASVPESKDDPVTELFFPEPVAVAGGTTVVSAESGDPLAAIDETAGVAAIGGPLLDEGFEPDEAAEEDPTNTGYQVYPFVTNVVDRLTDNGLSTRVLVDGGHGQFNADFALGSEDMAYYQRYLEGQSTADAGSVALEQVNNLTDDAGPELLDSAGDPAASALLISTPVDEFSAAERTAVADFAAAGGAVILVGTAADTDALENFNPLVSALNSSVSFTSTSVTDEDNNLGETSLPTTTNFADEPDLFTAFTPDSETSEPAPPSVAVTDVSGGDEYAVIDNTSSQTVDLEDWTLSDEAENTYTFGSTSLSSGETVVVTTNNTPSGVAPAADYTVNWDVGFIWNDDGDTATLRNASGVTVDTFSY
jgi:endonuclease YncB( thermonuclease family)